MNLIENISKLRKHRPAVMLVVFLYLVSMAGMPASTMAQTSTEAPQTPDVVSPGTGEDEADATPEATEPPADEEVTPNATPDSGPVATAADGLGISATDPGFPAVIAHGLAYLNGQQAVWQVRELVPPSVNSAKSESGDAALIYQVEGSSVIRNDVTGKRALLEPGEAYFKAGGDAYTTMAAGSGSKIWVFEVVPTSSVDDDAFYESPMIDDYDEGVYDMVMVRYVLKAGESADIPNHTGPGMIMSTGGDVDIDSGGLGLLSTGDGQLITAPGTVTNNSNATIQYVFVGYGAAVGDESAKQGSAANATAIPGSSSSSDSSDSSTDSTDSTDSSESSGDGVTPAAGQTTINITAEADIYVVVVADGTTVFDGPIPQGGQSGAIAGTEFTVYTSSGTNTAFTNACGSEFKMGFEEGEATYTMTAQPC